MPELRPPHPALWTPQGVRIDDLDGYRPSIGSLFRLPERFLRSVHLERDFDDPTSLYNYVTTPTMVAQFNRLLAGLRQGSGHRAWRITGDYGTGSPHLRLSLHIFCATRQSRLLNPYVKP